MGWRVDAQLVAVHAEERFYVVCRKHLEILWQFSPLQVWSIDDQAQRFRANTSSSMEVDIKGIEP